MASSGTPVPDVTKIKDLDTGLYYTIDEYMQREQAKAAAKRGSFLNQDPLHQQGPSQAPLARGAAAALFPNKRPGQPGHNQDQAPVAGGEDGSDEEAPPGPDGSRKKAGVAAKKFKNWAKSTLATVKERIEEHKQERSREQQQLQQQQQAEEPLQLAPLSQGLAARRSMALEGQETAMAAAAAAAQQHRQQQTQQQQHASQQLQQRWSTDMGSQGLPAKGSLLQSAATVQPASSSSSSTSSQPLAIAVCGDAAAASPNRHPPATAGAGSPCPEGPSPQPLTSGDFGSPPLDVLTSACVERPPTSDASGYGSSRPPGFAACSPYPPPDAQLLRQRLSTAEASTPSPAQPYPVTDRASSPVEQYLPTAYTAPAGAGLGLGVAAGTGSSPGDTRAAAVTAGSPGPCSMNPLSSKSVVLPGAASAPARGGGVSSESAGVASAGRGVAGEEQQVLELLREPLLRGDPREEVELSSRAVPSGHSFLNQPARVSGSRKPALRQLQQVVMVQEVFGHDGVVWAMRFSADARLLASGGRDGVLRVWSVYWGPAAAGPQSSSPAPAPLDARAASAPNLAGPSTSSPDASSPSSSSQPGASPRPPLLSPGPLMTLAGHKADILDLAWSRCRLLLTASADTTARLWTVEAVPGECLRAFPHPDFVTSCAFHPRDPKLIATGCADGKVRVWSVPAGTVLCAATVQQDVVTRVLFGAPHGQRLVVGTLRGRARHYEFNGQALESVAQIDVKSAGSNGRKVTGLVQAPLVQGPYGNEMVYVITSADSRIRLFVGYLQERKFKGHRLSNTQIAASLSPSCAHLICGSDDGWVYVWETGLPPQSLMLPGSLPGTASSAPGLASSTAPTSLAAAAAAAAAASDDGHQQHGEGGALGPIHSAKGRAALPRGKAKETTYECFETPEQTVTVAVIAPDVCRLGRAAELLAGGTAATVPTASLLGALMLVAGFDGRIYVYENLPGPPAC